MSLWCFLWMKVLLHIINTLFVCLFCLTGGRELHSDCLALVQAPTVQVESQLTLPLDINNYPLSKFIQLHLRVSCAFRFISTLALKALKQQ